MKIRQLTRQEDWREWDRFVKEHPKSSLYHTLEWKNILEATFGYKARFLVAESGAGIIDILPLYMVSILGLWKKFVCIPLSGSYSAFLSDNSTAHSLLIGAAAALGRKEGVQYIEIRDSAPNAMLTRHNFIERRPFYFPQLAIQDVETNSKILTHGHRESISKSQKKGVVVESSNNKKDLKKFYEMLEGMYQEFGTPIFSFSYLSNMWDNLMPHDFFKLYTITYNDQTVGGGCNLIYRDQMIYKYGTYLPSARKLFPIHGFLWFTIEECVRRGLRSFNLGATSAGDKGLLQFKKSFGAVENPGYFYYLPVKGKPPAMDTYLDSFHFIKKIWRLLPRRLLRIIGPQFYRWIC